MALTRRLALTLALAAAFPAHAVEVPVKPMSDEAFWRIMDLAPAAPGDDPESQLEDLAKLLRELPPDEILAFDGAMTQHMARSYTWDLWGAVYVAHGGASDDGFEYFRLWLISKGHVVFEKVLGEPDSLADLKLAPGPDGVFEFEQLAYVPRETWAAKTGRSPDDMPATWSGLYPNAPTGEPFDPSEVGLEKRYPRLWKKYGRHPLG